MHGAERARATHFLTLGATQMYLTLDVMAAFVRCRYKAFLKCSWRNRERYRVRITRTAVN